MENRAPIESLIWGSIFCGDDESVCEVCGAWRKQEDLKTTWINGGATTVVDGKVYSDEEGIDHCPECTVVTGGEGLVNLLDEILDKEEGYAVLPTRVS